MIRLLVFLYIWDLTFSHNHGLPLSVTLRLFNYPDTVVGVSVAILIVLFSLQRLGTDKVGFAFAPVIILWFSFIGGIGLFNLFKYDLGVLRAFNPKYIIDYFKRNGKQGWISLGGVVLCITGDQSSYEVLSSLFFLSSFFPVNFLL